MKKVLFAAFISFNLLAGFSQEPDPLSYLSLKPEEFSEELRIVNNPLILDVREIFEFRRSRLPGALNVPSRASLDNLADTIDKARHIFVYCTTDFRSKAAARILAKKGFIHVYNLEGGIAGLRRHGHPIDRKKIDKPGNR